MSPLLMPFRYCYLLSISHVMYCADLFDKVWLRKGPRCGNSRCHSCNAYASSLTIGLLSPSKNLCRSETPGENGAKTRNVSLMASSPGG